MFQNTKHQLLMSILQMYFKGQEGKTKVFYNQGKKVQRFWCYSKLNCFKQFNIDILLTFAMTTKYNIIMNKKQEYIDIQINSKIVKNTVLSRTFLEIRNNIFHLLLNYNFSTNFQVVQEYERAVIFRLGRLLQGGSRGPGTCVKTFVVIVEFDVVVVRFDFDTVRVKLMVNLIFLSSLMLILWLLSLNLMLMLLMQNDAQIVVVVVVTFEANVVVAFAVIVQFDVYIRGLALGLTMILSILK